MVKNILAILLLCSTAAFPQDAVSSRANEDTIASSPKGGPSQISPGGKSATDQNDQHPVEDSTHPNPPSYSPDVQEAVTGTDKLIQTQQAQTKRSPANPSS